MRKLLLLLCLLATPAMAQDAPLETVTTHGSSLVGVWHGGLIQFGLWNSIIPFSDPKLMGIIDGFCRIGLRKDALGMSCLQTSDNPPITTDGTHLHFAGGSFIGGGGFDGDQVSAGQLRGRYWVRRWGVRYENPSASLASRVTADPAAPDKAGKAALLRRILDDGLAGVPQDAEALKKNGPAFSPLQLGAIQAVTYLGQETKWDWPPPPETKLDMSHLRFEDIPHRPDFFSVYHVRFADGERLCGLHQREDGVLDALRCV
jgi:hypothetical protein